jgi:hypothetical protein
MSNVGWIIEDDLFDSSNDRLVDELQKRGQSYQLVKYTMAGFNGFAPRFNYKGPTVYRGSIQGCRAVQRELNITPGPLCNWDVYDCSYYYPRLKGHLLNKPNIMLPYGALLEPDQMEFIFTALGEDRTVFIRPDSGFKTFTGRAVFKEDYANSVEQMGFGGIEPEKMVLISKPVNIVREERLVIHKGKFVTGSQYRKFDKVCEDPYISSQSIAYAEYVAKDIDWQPEPLWIMDLAHTKSGETKVLEIGAFSIAGLYNCDIAKVVDAVNVATMEYFEDFIGDSYENYINSNSN